MLLLDIRAAAASGVVVGNVILGNANLERIVLIPHVGI
jgi:hypothetical protein